MTTNITPEWKDQVENHVELDPEGRMFRVSSTYTPINPAKAVASFIANVGVLTPLLGADTRAFFKDSATIVLHRLRQLPFRMGMKLDYSSVKQNSEPEDVRYLPAFDQFPAGVEVSPPFTYVPPASQHLMLVMDSDNYVSYLLALDPKTGFTYHPELPNIFADGRLCTGEGVSQGSYDPNLGLQTYLDRFLRDWCGTRWNSDLHSEGNDIVKWLKFSGETKRNVLPEGVVWTDWFVRAVPPVNIAEALEAYRAEA